MINITHKNRRFIRHYVEMVIAMFLGMIVLGIPAEAGLRALGSSSSELMDDAPALMLLGMAVNMTVPMVAWMRRTAKLTAVGVVPRTCRLGSVRRQSPWAAGWGGRDLSRPVEIWAGFAG